MGISVRKAHREYGFTSPYFGFAETSFSFVKERDVCASRHGEVVLVFITH